MSRIYMVNCNAAGSVFVKTYSFWKRQGGLTEPWGKHWEPIIADSIEDARRKGCARLPGARPYEQQAW